MPLNRIFTQHNYQHLIPREIWVCELQVSSSIHANMRKNRERHMGSGQLVSKMQCSPLKNRMQKMVIYTNWPREKKTQMAASAIRARRHFCFCFCRVDSLCWSQLFAILHFGGGGNCILGHPCRPHLSRPHLSFPELCAVFCNEYDADSGVASK